MARLIFTFLVGLSLISLPSWAANLDKGIDSMLSGDYAAAFLELLPLAEQGNPKAQTLIGVMFEKGEGRPKDKKKAVRWYKLAAEQGNANAQHNLGYMYQYGTGIRKDYKEAVRWYRLAAEQGYYKSQTALGYMYYEGLGVPKDKKETVRWYRLAA